MITKNNSFFSPENLALNKPAYQQHPYSGPIPSHLTEASNAVDGLSKNFSVWGGQCVYSDDGQQTATLWINLTRILNIADVSFEYMLGDSAWGLFFFSYETMYMYKSCCIPKHVN